MTNLLGSIRLAAYAFPLIAVLVAVPFFDRQVRARCFNWGRTVFGAVRAGARVLPAAGCGAGGAAERV